MTRMYIVRTEDPATSSTARCENCDRVEPGRKVEALDWLHRRSRGWLFLCYQCFGPRILWRKSVDSARLYETPAETQARKATL